MYAIIQTGGKQYRVAVGQTIQVEALEKAAGETVAFDQVLLVGSGAEVKVGKPFLEKAAVLGEVIKHGRGEKIFIYKFRRRKYSDKRTGHRQNHTVVKIQSIKA